MTLFKLKNNKVLRIWQNISCITVFEQYSIIIGTVFEHKYIHLYFVMHKFSSGAFNRMALFIAISESMYESCKPLPITVSTLCHCFHSHRAIC